jgi:hypothetical protein
MASNRSAIPKATRESVLNLFGHRCAIPSCHTPNPQLHHIDHDRENNEPENLIALCPTHHLLGQHGSHQEIKPERLRFYRIHRHPLILHRRFRPVFNRLTPLFAVSAKSNSGQVRRDISELSRFVGSLEHGDYYAKSISRLTAYETFTASFSIPMGGTVPQWYVDGKNNEIPKYLAKVAENRERIVELVVEMLDFQEWPTPPQ